MRSPAAYYCKKYSRGFIPSNATYTEVENLFGHNPEQFWIYWFNGSPFIDGNFDYNADGFKLRQGKIDSMTTLVRLWKERILGFSTSFSRAKRINHI